MSFICEASQEENDDKIQPKLHFDGIFKGREAEIRITVDKQISVFDFISVVGDQINPEKTWVNFLHDHGEELGITRKSNYARFGKTKKTPVLNVHGMVKLLFWLPKQATKVFRSKSTETMISYLGGNSTLLKDFQEKQRKSFQEIPEMEPVDIEEIPEMDPVEEIPETDPVEEIPEIEPLQELIPLQFEGIFKGRETEIRITPDKKVSVFDFIRVVGGQTNPKQTWQRILNDHGEELGIVSKMSLCSKNEVVTKKLLHSKTKNEVVSKMPLHSKSKNEVVSKWDYFKFNGMGQRLTPVINVQGMVKLLFWLPGQTAKVFRSKSAEIMIRYLGGDLTLVNEIKTIDQEHIVNPNNVAQVFRKAVTQRQNLIFNQDQINTSNKLVNYYGNKKDIFYAFLFKYKDELYSKYGIAGEVREFYKRIEEHTVEFEEICFYNIMCCANVYKVESEFKNTALVNLNKVKIPKKHTGNHTEIIKLSEIVTTNSIKEEMYKVAGDRMIDPPPVYSVTQLENSNSNGDLEIEREHTKQKQIELEMKKLELEMKKMEFEIVKLQMSKNPSAFA